MVSTCFDDPLVVSCAAPVANLSAYLMATTWFRCSACRVVCSSRRHPECSAEDGNCVSTRLLSFRFPLLTSVPALIATLEAVPLATFVSMSHELLFFYGIGDVSRWRRCLWVSFILTSCVAGGNGRYGKLRFELEKIMFIDYSWCLSS